MGRAWAPASLGLKCQLHSGSWNPSGSAAGDHSSSAWPRAPARPAGRCARALGGLLLARGLPRTPGRRTTQVCMERSPTSRPSFARNSGDRLWQRLSIARLQLREALPMEGLGHSGGTRRGPRVPVPVRGCVPKGRGSHEESCVFINRGHGGPRTACGQVPRPSFHPRDPGRVVAPSMANGILPLGAGGPVSHPRTDFGVSAHPGLDAQPSQGACARVRISSKVDRGAAGPHSA